MKQMASPAPATSPEGKAVEGIRDLRMWLAEGNPDYSNAVSLENDAEGFCRDVRLRLREHRKARGLDQTAVGKLLDMTQSAVSKIESSEGDLGMKSVFRYAHALGLVPVCVFLPDSSRLFPKEAVMTAKAAHNLQTALVNDTSKAVSSAVAGFARAFGAR
jgi:transcriptional regulator with XRE-family HTH domain